MVRDHPDLNPANAAMPGDHLLRVISLKLVEMTVVEQTLEQLSGVVRLSMIFGNDVVQLFDRTQRFTSRLKRGR